MNASTADVPDMLTPEGEDVIIDDLRTRGLGAAAATHTTLAWWPPVTAHFSACRPARQSPSFASRSGRSSRWRSIARRLPLARRIAYHLALSAQCHPPAGVTPPLDDNRTRRVDVNVQHGLDQLAAATRVRVVGQSDEWQGVLRKATQVAATNTTVLITGESGRARKSWRGTSMQHPRGRPGRSWR